MRLIDADELIKILEEYANDKDSQAIYGEERLRLILGDCKIEIEKFPTAYDVDKVVEQLEKESQNIELIYPTDQGYDYEDAIGIDINKAKQIVKSGGIAEEKKSEWKEHFASRFGRIE